MAKWRFYGRRAELADIDQILARGAFFFCAISGRRRIGKTSLIQEALRRRRRDAIYVQIPDSDERGVIQTFEDALQDSGISMDVARRANSDFTNIALTLSVHWEMNWVTVIDEFQYFNRKVLSEFQSHLQRVLDQARGDTGIKGGIFTLGSIHTEMTAILEDRNAPLFNRVTDRLSIGHWDFETLFEMFRAHEITDPYHRLFLWTLFEGVPKFYRDCFDQGVLIPNPNHRADTLTKMFFEGSSPLRDEADNWFLRELRGRYDTVLTLLARSGPVSHGALKADYDRTGTGGEKQLAGYLKTLIEKYGMIEKLQPVLSGLRERKARYAISDNFLSAWLAAIARNVRLAKIQPVPLAVARTDTALMAHEGFAFEKLVRQAIQECSRKGVGDFVLSEMVSGFWNKADGGDIEIDVVALDAERKIIRFGSCKRNEDKHNAAELAVFEGHVTRFQATKTGQRFQGWSIEKALYSPGFSDITRQRLDGIGYVLIDLDDFERWLKF